MASRQQQRRRPEEQEAAAVAANLAAQADEIEALEAIYGEAFAVIETDDSTERASAVRVEVWEQPVVSLLVFLPPEYPSHRPPVAQIESNWLLTDDMKDDLDAKMHTAYEDAAGEVILFTWVEIVKEYVAEYIEATTQSQAEPSLGSSAPGAEVEEWAEDGGAAGSEAVAHDEAAAQISHYEDYSDELNGLPGKPTGWKLNIIHAEPMMDRKSTFQAHEAEVHSVEEVREVMQQLLSDRKIARATHNIMAYRIFDESRGLFIKDNDDDGETGAASRMAHIMEIMDVRNVIVVVSRWFGGILLGQDRFKHINNCARRILEDNGYVAVKPKKSGPTSHSDGQKLQKKKQQQSHKGHHHR